MKRFETIFLREAMLFFETMEEKARRKVILNISKAELTNDPQLFKKLRDEIREFRTLYNGIQYRLLAFWDKRDNQDTLVVCTHGIVKKTDKVPSKEIEKAKSLREEYLAD